MKILELAARLVPGDLLEADDGLHRIVVIERHKDFSGSAARSTAISGCGKNLEVWIDAPVNLASFAKRRVAGTTDVPAIFEGERRRR